MTDSKCSISRRSSDRTTETSPTNDILLSQGKEDGDNTRVLSDDLKRYIQLNEEEKKVWLDYVETLKKRYYDLKKDVKSRKKTVIDNVDFLEHIPEEEKLFYHEVMKAKDSYLNIYTDLNKLNDIIFILNQELLNQSNFILQKINVKKEYISSNYLSHDY